MRALDDDTVDAPLLLAWLTARSIGRGLPAPVEDRGGYRVDTGSAVESVRWVFPRVTEGLRALSHAMLEPRSSIKLCASDETLRACLPSHWEMQPGAFVMTGPEAWSAASDAPLPDGYRQTRERDGPTTRVDIHASDGALAASGYAVEAAGVFAYDRIVTDVAHQRRGLGRAVMRALADERGSAASRPVLVATADGRALCRTLGWSVAAPYASATIRS